MNNKKGHKRRKNKRNRSQSEFDTSDVPNELPDEPNELPTELRESEGNALNESRERGLEPEELVPSPTLLTNANMVVIQGRDWFCNTVEEFVLRGVLPERR